MLIGIDASRACREKKTGTEWYSYYVISEIIKLDLENTYRLYIHKDQEIPFTVPFLRGEARKVSWPFQRFWTHGGLSLEMAHHPPDVLFVPSHVIPLIHPARTVTTVHDVGFLQFRHMFSKRDFFYLDWSTRYAVTHARMLCAISEFTKQELIRYYHADPDRITVTPLGVDRAFFEERIAPEKARECLARIGISQPYVLYIGRIDYRKNIDALIDAFQSVAADVPNLSLILAGPPGFGSASIYKKIARMPCATSIRVLQWIDEHRKCILLQNAACFVFPSWYEGFGLPLLEAQSASTPLVCSQAGALKEVAGNGALYFDPRESASCAEQIRIVLSDSAHTSRLVSNGRENVRQFSWQHTARATLEALLRA